MEYVVVYTDSLGRETRIPFRGRDYWPGGEPGALTAKRKAHDTAKGFEVVGLTARVEENPAG